MLRYSKLKGLPLKATDGEIGSIEGAIIDLEDWGLRYMLVKTGSWLSHRTVMIATESIVEMNEDAQNLVVNLSQQQVKDSPEPDPEVPMTRDSEIALREYYGLPMYWTQHGDPIQPHHAPDAVRDKVVANDVVTRRGSSLVDNESVLCDLEEITNYSVESSDEDIGRLDDIIINEKTWRVDRFVVNLSNYLPSKMVLVNKDWLADVDWVNESIQLEATSSAVKGSPYYRPFGSLFMREDELTESVPPGE